MHPIFFAVAVCVGLIALAPPSSHAQIDFAKALEPCGLHGSVTVYDYQKKTWYLSDSVDARRLLPPASTFKIPHLLIALETGAIADENEAVAWPGHTDTTLYGYRPNIYKDMTVKEAFAVSAGWVFMEIAKGIPKEVYRDYLERLGYGNGDPDEGAVDFWNFGPLRISPVNQVEFLMDVYEETGPFSSRNYAILKRVMITEETRTYTLRSKTGWGRADGLSVGWWTGYVEREGAVFFFATRLTKPLSDPHPSFAACRVSVTQDVLRQLGAID